MSDNLAGILTSTAERHGDRTAFKLDDIELSYTQLDCAAARDRAPAGGEGGRARRPRGADAPERALLPRDLLRRSCAPAAVVVPMNVLLKGREVELLPRATPARSCCSPGTTSPRPPRPGPSEAGAETHARQAGRVRAARGRLQRRARRRRARRRRHRGDPLHERDHRPAQGRRADPRQPAAQLRGTVARFAEIDENEVLLGALPLFHSFGQTCTMNSAVGAGAMRDDAAALRSREGARDHRARQGHRLPGRAHDVQRDAARQTAPTPPTCRRCACCMSGGAAIPVELIRGFEEKFGCDDPRGLRALGDLAGRLVQPSRQGAQGGLDRHAASRAWRCRSGTTTATRCRRARWARS